MQSSTYITILFLAIIVFMMPNVESKKGIKLSKIEVLTLHKGRHTAARRTSPIPQLQCQAGPCYKHAPDTVQCYSKGKNDRGIVQWECKAELSKNIIFGKIHVSCEGYSRAGDKYVLPGSCGLEFELKQTGPDASSRTHTHHYDEDEYYFNNSNGFNWVGALVIVVGILFMIYVCQCATSSNRYSPPPSVNPEYDAPPAYSPGSARCRNTYYNNGRESSWWSGFTMGQWFSTPSRTTHNYYGRSSPSRSYRSSSSYSSSSSSSSPSSSSSTRSSSGFGGSSSR